MGADRGGEVSSIQQDKQNKAKTLMKDTIQTLCPLQPKPFEMSQLPAARAWSGVKGGGGACFDWFLLLWIQSLQMIWMCCSHPAQRMTLYIMVGGVRLAMICGALLPTASEPDHRTVKQAGIMWPASCVRAAPGTRMHYGKKASWQRLWQSLAGKPWVWGDVWSCHPCGCYFGTYLTIVARHIHPFMETAFPDGHGLFQQDNASCHEAKLF